MIPCECSLHFSVVREKELGSIINFYATPVTRAEFLLGKQPPYIALGVVNFLLMALAVTIFGVPMKGVSWVLLLASGLFVGFATGFGLFIVHARAQIAAIFATMIATMIPTINTRGSSTRSRRWKGSARRSAGSTRDPHDHRQPRCVQQGLRLHDLHDALWAIGLSVPVILIAAVAMLRKQER